MVRVTTAIYYAPCSSPLDEILGFFGGKAQPMMGQLAEAGKLTREDVRELNGAHVRHRIWMVASLKFLVPFSLLTGLGKTLRVDAGGNERAGGLASTSWISTDRCR